MDNLRNKVRKRNLKGLSGSGEVQRILILVSCIVTGVLTTPAPRYNHILQDCFNKSEDIFNYGPPICVIEIVSGNTPVSTCTKLGVISIQGAYEAVHINCTADYALDFRFDGTLPTEAINVTLRRVVQEGSNLQNISYHADVTVTSVHSLLERLCKKCRYSEANAYNYSRTGNYIFSGFHDLANLTTSFYIFYDEPGIKPDFVRNKKLAVATTDNETMIPCRPTHITSDVELLGRDGGRIIISDYWPNRGFVIDSSEPSLWADPEFFECRLRDNDHEAVITFETGSDGERNGSDHILPIPDITPNLEPMSFGTFGTKVICNLHEYWDGETTMLTAIGAANEAMHRLTREFVLPEFVNRSHTVLIGTRENDFKHMKIATLIPENVISIFCGNKLTNNSKSVGTTISCDIYPFKFNEEWNKLERNVSYSDRYFLIGHNNTYSQFYENQPVEFKCRISTYIMVPPAVWYVRYVNGTLREALIDHFWKDGISYFTTIIDANYSAVICAASIWHKNEWWNFTENLTVAESSPPFFESEEDIELDFVEKSHQVLECTAFGSPTPEMFWKRDGKIISNKSMLVFQNVTEQNEGEYICAADNGIGVNQKIFSVNVVPGESKVVSSELILGLAAGAVILTSMCLFIYIRFVKSPKGGLTPSEIQEFMEGRLLSINPEEGDDVYYALSGLMPYDRKYEVPEKQFQIEKSNVLGTGAYGIVYKGLLDGRPVAVKTVKENTSDASFLKSLLSELKVMVYLDSNEYLVQLIGAHTKKLSRGVVYVFVDYCPLGSLEKYLKENRDSACLEHVPHYSKVGLATMTTSVITLKDLYNWSKQIAQGMAYLSKKKVIHGDLATRNVLLTQTKTVKITDFGLSRRLYDYSEYVRTKEERLPWRWLAPESMRNSVFSSKSDIWAYGVALWEIFSLAEIPYNGATWGLAFLNQIEDGMRLPLPKFASPELYNEVMLESWQNNPENRPSFETLYSTLEAMAKAINVPTGYICNTIKDNGHALPDSMTMNGCYDHVAYI